MPPRWQKETMYANSMASISENTITAHGGSCVAESYSNNKSGGCGSNQVNRQTVPLRKASISTDRRERHSSAVLRHKCQQGSRSGRPTSERALYERHTLRHQRQRGIATFKRWLGTFSRTDTGCDHQAKHRTGRFVHAQKCAGDKRNVDERRQRGNSIVHRFLSRMPVFPSMWKAFRASLLCLILASLMPMGAANAAASLVIRPTRIIITQDAPVVAITIENTGNSEAVIQMQLMSWSQENGEDIYGPSDTLGVMACPSMVSIPAGESQIVRVGLEDIARSWDTEGTFRLFIQEIPPKAVEGATAVQVAVRIGIPVFLPPTNFVQPTLNWQIKAGDQGGTWMTVVNEGTSHALISGVQLKQDEFLFQTNTHQYILPGATISWRLDQANPIADTLPGSVELLASTDQGSYQETLQIDR